jgi:hypothetical protein
MDTFFTITESIALYIKNRVFKTTMGWNVLEVRVYRDKTGEFFCELNAYPKVQAAEGCLWVASWKNKDLVAHLVNKRILTLTGRNLETKDGLVVEAKLKQRWARS